MPNRPSGDRIMLATVGVAVPDADASLLMQAVATEAERCGYQAVVAECDHVSGVRPDHFIRRHPAGECPRCKKTIGRYPGVGQFYRHNCQRQWVIDLPYDRLLISENDRLHPMQRHKLTTQLRNDAWKLAKHHKLPLCERVRVTLHWRPKTRRPRDVDNPTPTLKALCDGLTDAALVRDDTHDRMEKQVEIHDPEQGQPTKLWLTIEAL